MNKLCECLRTHVNITFFSIICKFDTYTTFNNYFDIQMCIHFHHIALELFLFKRKLFWKNSHAQFMFFRDAKNMINLYFADNFFTLRDDFESCLYEIWC